MNVITFRDGIDEIDEIKERYRRLYNVNTIVVGEGPFASIEILNALGRNEIVAMLVDRGAEDGVEVDFFGMKTSFSFRSSDARRGKWRAHHAGLCGQGRGRLQCDSGRAYLCR